MISKYRNKSYVHSTCTTTACPGLCLLCFCRSVGQPVAASVSSNTDSAPEAAVGESAAPTVLVGTMEAQSLDPELPVDNSAGVDGRGAAAPPSVLTGVDDSSVTVNGDAGDSPVPARGSTSPSVVVAHDDGGTGPCVLGTCLLYRSSFFPTLRFHSISFFGIGVCTPSLRAQPCTGT